jgi:ABC-type uncharacterized transport system permease subunit
VPLAASLALAFHHRIDAGLVIFAYGYTRLVRSIHGLLFAGLDWLPVLVQMGDLDRFLMAPANWLVSVSLSQVTIAKASAVACSIALIAISHEGYSLVGLAAALPLTLIIYWQVSAVIAMTVSFWWMDPRGTLSGVYQRIVDFYQYPETLYPRTLRDALWTFPLGLAVFASMRVSLSGQMGFLIAQLALALVGAMAVNRLSTAAISRYQGTGGRGNE